MGNVVFPFQFEERMRSVLGRNWQPFAEAHELQPSVAIRHNPRKARLPEKGIAVPWAAWGRYLPERPVFTLDPAWHAGSYYVQEASSMFLEQAIRQHIDCSRPLVALDLCGAPGGKTTHLSALLSDQALVVSNEVIRSRASILQENVQKWGYPNTVVTNSDPSHMGRLGGFFDVIVVDAPCSGEGLFRKDPAAAREWSEEKAALCSARQRRILTDVWPALNQNGILIYCTCTYNSEENEANMAWLSRQHAATFKRLQLQPEWGVEEITHGPAVGYSCYPHRVEGEGFFLSVVQKEEATANTSARLDEFESPPRKSSEALLAWLKHPEAAALISRGDEVQFFPVKWMEALMAIKAKLNLVSAGTAMASIKRDKLVPQHAMALSTEFNRDYFPSLDLDLDDALRFLRKEPTKKHPEASGFVLVQWNTLSLGWLNAMTNRSNNLYPTAWRIRMAAKG